MAKKFEAVDFLENKLKPNYKLISLYGKYIYQYSDGLYKRIELDTLKGTIKAELDKYDISTYNINEIASLWLISLECLKNDEDICRDSNLINFKNGIIDINQNRLYSHDPSYLFINKIETNYVPGAQCPEFIKFINDVIPNKHEQQLFQELCGIAISNFVPEYITILYGKSKSGKSTVLNLLTSIIGERDTTNLSIQQINARFGVDELYGKLISIGPDSSQDDIKDTGRIKGLTGSDSILAELKYAGFKKLKNTTKLFFQTNHLLDFSVDRSGAMEERIRTIHFRNTIPTNQRDKDLLSKLVIEKEGVLNWMMEGLFRYLRNGKILTEPNVICFNNALKAFIDSYCEIDEHQINYCTKSTFHDLYNKFRKDLELKPISAQEIAKELELQFGIYSKQVGPKNLMSYVGLSLKVYDNNFDFKKDLSQNENNHRLFDDLLPDTFIPAYNSEIGSTFEESDMSPHDVDISMFDHANHIEIPINEIPDSVPEDFFKDIDLEHLIN